MIAKAFVSGDSISKAKTVLLVEDNKENLMLANDALEVSGYRVLVAETGAAALKILEKETPDIIVMDLMLPNMSGHQIIKKIRRSPVFHDVPVVVCTASGHREDVLKCVRLGIHDYILKPFSIKAFINRIDMILSGAAPSIMQNDGKQYEDVDLTEEMSYGDFQEPKTGGISVVQIDDGFSAHPEASSEEAQEQNIEEQSVSAKRSLPDLQEGMVLKENIKRNDVVIVAEGTKLTQQLIDRLKEWEIKEIEVCL